MADKDYELFVYDEEKWQRVAGKRYLIDEPAEIREYENAIALPPRYRPSTVKKYGDGLLEGGLCSSKFKFLAGLKRSHGKADVNRNCSFSYKVNKTDIEFRDESVIFGGLVMSHFGHMLCDGTTRLWYMTDNPGDTTKVVFVVYPNQTFPYWELLEMAGIARDRVEIITKPTQFAHVFVPDETSFSLGRAGYKREWTHVLQRIRDSVQPAEYKKIYYTRLNLAQSGCVGERYFADFFRANGYHVVSPEKLSFREQVALMAGADEFAATMGTIANQIMFAKPGTHLTVLNRSENAVEGVPLSVQAAGAHATYVDSFANLLPEKQGGYSVHLLAVNRHWQGFLQAHDELDVDAVGDYPLADNVVEYLREWGKRYETPQYYRWIRNETLPSVVRRINRYLRNTELSSDDYPQPASVERLEQQCEKLDSSLCASRAAAPEYALTHTEVAEGSIALSGSVPLPLVALDSCKAEVRLFIKGKADLNPGSDLDLERDSPGMLRWRQSFAIPADLKLNESIQGQISIEANGESIALPLAAAKNALDTPTFLPFPAFGLRESTDLGSKILASAVAYAALIPEELDYEIESISWSETILNMQGTLQLAFLCARDMHYELVLTDGDSIAMNPSFKMTTGENGASWVCTIDIAEVAQQMAGNDLAQLNWHWRVSIAGASRLLQFGKRRFTGAMQIYRRQFAVSSDKVALPIDFGDREMGFRCVRADVVNLEARITQANLDGDCACLEGTLSHHLAACEAVSASVALTQDDKIIRFPTVIRADADTRAITWATQIDLKSMTCAERFGSWQLCFALDLNGLSWQVPFGRKRPKGTLPKIAPGYFDGASLRTVFAEDSNKDLLVRVENPPSAASRLARKVRRLMR